MGSFRQEGRSRHHGRRLRIGPGFRPARLPLPDQHELGIGPSAREPADVLAIALGRPRESGRAGIRCPLPGRAGWVPAVRKAGLAIPALELRAGLRLRSGTGCRAKLAGRFRRGRQEAGPGLLRLLCLSHRCGVTLRRARGGRAGFCGSLTGSRGQGFGQKRNHRDGGFRDPGKSAGNRLLSFPLPAFWLGRLDSLRRRRSGCFS